MSKHAPIELLRISEVAEQLGTTPGSLREGLHTGRIVLPLVRIGRRAVRVDAADLAVYVAANKCLSDGSDVGRR